MWKPLPPRFFKIDMKEPETTVRKSCRENAAKIFVMAAMTSYRQFEKEKKMKYSSKMKKQAVALALALALGLVLSASTGPVYGSTTVSISTGGQVAQVDFAREWYDRATSAYTYARKAYDWLFGVADPGAQADYPSTALDR